MKERLVGAAVLVAIAVIFIPIIFNDAPETESIKGSNIPEKPETDFNSRIVPMTEVAGENGNTEESPSTGEPAMTGSDQSLTENQIKDDANIQPEIIAESIAPLTDGDDSTSALKQLNEPKSDVGLSAWIVQLGSFSSEENAQSLKEKLRKAGYPAFVEPLKKNGQSSYRVRVGPEIKRSDADSLLKQLKDKMKLDGIVVAYP